MKSGLLWFDNSERSLQEKIEKALQYHLETCGKAATLVYIHPMMLEEGVQVEGVQIFVTNSVLMNHFWIGVVENV